MRNSSRKIFGVPVFRRAGVTLTELMVAVSVLTLGVIGSMGAFKYINRAMTQSRIKTIATNLAQEKMEVLRNKSYFQLLVTTATDVSTGYSPNFTYDLGNYPPEVITLWGMPALTRVVKVDYVTLSGSVATALSYNDNDPGMKKITVSVMWTEVDTPKKVQIDSYYENPTAAVLSAGFSGTITNAAGGAAVGDALIQVQGSPKWRGYSDPATGEYRFQVAPGTYTLVCSTQGYYSATSAEISVEEGEYTGQDFSLTKIATGAITGTAYIRSHPVIYMVVASTVMLNGTGDNVDFISLYNPTTYQINMLTDPAVSTSNNLKIAYYGEAGASDDIAEFWLQHRSTFIPAGYHYLVASTGTFTWGGVPITADAVYGAANSPPCDLIGSVYSCITKNKAGAIRISDVDGNVLDTLGWSNTGAAKTAPYFEGTACPRNAGLPEGAQFFRYTSAGSGQSGTGSCYDTDNNNGNFFYFDPSINGFYPMGKFSGSKPPVTGTPAAGAVVTANDGLSTSVLASSTGFFQLTNVATAAVLNVGSSWEMLVASNTIFISSAGLVITVDQNKNVGTIALSSSVSGGIATGYVYGSGPDQNRALGNPTIKVGSAGTTVYTNSQGYYRLFLGTGTAVITANYGSENGSYQSADETVTVTAGAVTSVPDFHLAQGGTISGYVTSGTGALPSVVVQASNGGPVYEDTSDGTGHFYISAATSSVAYTVTPVLDTLQSYTSQPSSPLTATLASPGSSVFSGTITVAGAMGTIAGTVVASTASITTGVLIVASTDTVNDPLPTITAATAPSLPVIYAVSSQADGTYSLDVRFSTTTAYNVRAFYPVVNAVTGSVTYTSRNFSSVWVSTAGATTTRNFVW